MELEEAVRNLEYKLYEVINNDSWYWQEEIETVLKALRELQIENIKLKQKLLEKPNE